MMSCRWLYWNETGGQKERKSGVLCAYRWCLRERDKIKELRDEKQRARNRASRHTTEAGRLCEEEKQSAHLTGKEVDE